MQTKFMQSRFFVAVWLLVGTTCWSAEVAPTVDPKMLQEGGDCLEHEILAWERLRAERRAVIEHDDSPPIVCADPAGRIYLVNGAGQLLISDDSGQKFSNAIPPKTIMLDGQPVKDIQAFGVLKSATPETPWLGRPRGPLVIAYGCEGGLQIARSEDDGASWEKAGGLPAEGYAQLAVGGARTVSTWITSLMDPPRRATIQVPAGGGRITQLPDGSLLLAAGAWKDSGEADGLVFRSTDEGRTWTRHGNLGPRCVAANLLVTKQGDLLAAITYRGGRRSGDPEVAVDREELFHHVVVARSRDGGATWQDYQVVTRYKEAPGDLAERSDGTIVLTYGQQNVPYGARAKISKDGGKTWEPWTYLLGTSTVCLKWHNRPMPTHPGWQVSSAVARGDLLLTVYTRGAFVVDKVPKVEGRDYSDEVGKEKGKAAVLTRWRLEGMPETPLGLPDGLVLIAQPNREGYLENGRSLIKPEHLRRGGDFFVDEEILVYRRLAATHVQIGKGSKSIVALDSHGDPVVMCGGGGVYRSKDNGKTWQQSGQSPTIPQSFGVLRDGTLLYTQAVAVGDKETQGVYRSTDWGKTWSDPVLVDQGMFDSMGSGNNIRIYQMPDGTALQTGGNLYLKVIGDGRTLGGPHVDLPWDGIFRSRDGGKTWGDFSFIGKPLCESNLIRLKSGRMLCASRFQGSILTDDLLRLDKDGSDRPEHGMIFAKNTAITYSDDDGYTWKPFKTVTRFNECPGDLAEMPDGTVVLTFTQKNPCPTGMRGMISRDGGMSWEKTQYMLGWGHTQGHASSVVLKDGNVLTVNNNFSLVENGPVTYAAIWKPLPNGSSAK